MAYGWEKKKNVCNYVTYCQILFTLKQVKVMNQIFILQTYVQVLFSSVYLHYIVFYKHSTTYTNLYTIKVTNSYLQRFGKTLILFNSISIELATI